MSQTHPASLGIDVAKATFDAALLWEGKRAQRTFPMNPAGFTALDGWIHEPGLVDPPVERRESGRIHREGPLRPFPFPEQRRVERGFGHIDAQTRWVRLTHRVLLTGWTGDTRCHSCSSRLTTRGRSPPSGGLRYRPTFKYLAREVGDLI